MERMKRRFGKGREGGCEERLGKLSWKQNLIQLAAISGRITALSGH